MQKGGRDDAYRTIGRWLVAHAPRPYERLEARFRIHPSMLATSFAAYPPDGKSMGFFVRGDPLEEIKAAVQSLRETLPRDEADHPFVRADFHLDTNGRFRFRPYYAPHLLERMAEVLRAVWPEGVERLRLDAYFKPGPSGERRGWQLRHADVSGGADPRVIPNPRYGLKADFDTPLWLISDIEVVAGRPFETFAFELPRRGDHAAWLDGELYEPR